MRSRLVLLWMGLLLAGCQTAPRRAAPPELIGTATPPGFPPSVRLVTTDQRTFSALAPDFFGGIRSAAIDGTVDILALSGGGSGGAYGAGALAGMTRAHARPQFEMVTGVSAGALLAPFAFLGPDWDARMHDAFTGERSAKLLHSPTRSILSRLLSPRGLPHHNGGRNEGEGDAGEQKGATGEYRRADNESGSTNGGQYRRRVAPPSSDRHRALEADHGSEKPADHQSTVEFGQGGHAAWQCQAEPRKANPKPNEERARAKRKRNQAQPTPFFGWRCRGGRTARLRRCD